MPLKPKKTTKARTAKKVKKPDTKVTAKKAKKAKKPAAKKTAKKAIAKKSPAKKTVKNKKPSTRKPAKTSVKEAANKRVAKSPTKMAWRISPEISQSVVDIDIWKKDDLKIEHLKVYRSGWIIVDQLPDLSGYNPDEGVNILEEFAVEEHQLLDGSEGTSFFPKELPLEECERLMTLSEAELVAEGWTIESATRFTGPLVVEEV
jgi:hypothetical protein